MALLPGALAATAGRYRAREGFAAVAFDRFDERGDVADQHGDGDSREVVAPAFDDLELGTGNAGGRVAARFGHDQDVGRAVQDQRARAQFLQRFVARWRGHDRRILADRTLRIIHTVVIATDVTAQPGFVVEISR